MIVDAADGLSSVEIATFQEDDDGNMRVDNAADFELLVTRVMGFDSVEQFVSETAVQPEELIGQFWTTVRDRVYIRD